MFLVISLTVIATLAIVWAIVAAVIIADRDEVIRKHLEESAKRHEELLRFIAEQIAESNMGNQKYMRTIGRERFKVKVRKI